MGTLESGYIYEWNIFVLDKAHMPNAKDEKFVPAAVYLPDDFVTVVRCKDCKYGNSVDEFNERWECTWYMGSLSTESHDYCSRGERRE